MSGVRAHAAPFYCPYCGDEDLVPELPPDGGEGQGHGHWSCRACRRAFRLSLTAIAVARPEPAADRSEPAAWPRSSTRSGSPTTVKEA